MSNPIVTFEMENGDIIKAELYPEVAPNTVNNFISLVSKGFYDGLIFHRVIPCFMIQGGDPKGTGVGGPGYSIKGEFTANRFKNDLKHDRGVLSMARTMAPNSAGSQFFIMHENSPHLDGQYAAFGKVIDAAILFGTNKPSTWRTGVVPSAIAAGNGVPVGTSVFDDIMGENGLIAKVELDGFNPNGVMSAIQMRGKLRGLKDTTGQPIFKSDMQGATRYGLDGMDMYFPMNGAFDPAQAQMIVGDWTQLVYAIRQDMTFKIFTEGVIQDPSTKAITYNLMQNDMVALRAVMRLGWEIANPVNAYNVDIANPFPFSVYGKAGTVSTVTVSPATATVKKGASKAFAASVAGEGIVSGDVEWSQSGAKSSISENGILTVASNETSASITVTAKSKQDSTKTGTATVTVGS
mgnify:CR=1 FL=1